LIREEKRDGDMKISFLIIILIIFSLTVGCLSNSKDETVWVTMMISGVGQPMIFRCDLSYVDEENITVEIILNYTFNFTHVNMGANPSEHIPKKGFDLHFSLELFNNSIDETPYVFAERIIDNFDDRLVFEIYNLGFGSVPTINIYYGGGIP